MLEINRICEGPYYIIEHYFVVPFMLQAAMRSSLDLANRLVGQELPEEFS